MAKVQTTESRSSSLKLNCPNCFLPVTRNQVAPTGAPGQRKTSRLMLSFRRRHWRRPARTARQCCSTCCPRPRRRRRRPPRPRTRRRSGAETGPRRSSKDRCSGKSFDAAEAAFAAAAVSIPSRRRCRRHLSWTRCQNWTDGRRRQQPDCSAQYCLVPDRSCT